MCVCVCVFAYEMSQFVFIQFFFGLRWIYSFGFLWGDGILRVFAYAFIVDAEQHKMNVWVWFMCESEKHQQNIYERRAIGQFNACVYHVRHSPHSVGQQFCIGSRKKNDAET